MNRPVKAPLPCPHCGEPVLSAWNWLLPRSEGVCPACRGAVASGHATRSRQVVALILAVMAALMALGLLLAGEQWLWRALFGVLFYLLFNLWAVRRVSLQVADPDPE